jgi:hypothetical protein
VKSIESVLNSISNQVRIRWLLSKSQLLEQQYARQVAAQARPESGKQPVIFFNASTRIRGLSINAAYSLLTAWALRLQGIPVVHFVCNSGLAPCVQGTNRDQPQAPPPCQDCLAQSKAIFTAAQVHWFGFNSDPLLIEKISNLKLADLIEFEHGGIPLGSLVLPSIRWILRRYHLFDDEPTRYLYRQYLLSAWNISVEFKEVIDQYAPQAVVVFNGLFYPEAAVRWVARQRGIPVVSHETAFLPFSAFFTTGDATAYPIELPANFELTAQQNARLDQYLEQRFKGNFSMGGIRFWPEMRGLDEAFLSKVASYKQLVTIFTNVIFDTSQGHANFLFTDMFSWLDQFLSVFQEYPETLFVIRAHPDEGRPGKASQETVREWIEKYGANKLPNVFFVDSGEYISSYELIQRSKFVLIYNSSVGLEASILSATVLCAGKVRYSTPTVPTVILPESSESYWQKLRDFLSEETIQADPAHRRNARRFYDYQLFRASLPFDEFLESYLNPGFIRLKSFNLSDLTPEHSSSIRVLLDGILKGKPYFLDDAVQEIKQGSGRDGKK